MIASAAQFIEEKGVRAISDATGKEPGAVRLWKHRNCIPRGVWPELLDAFPDVTLDALKQMERAA